MIIAQGSANETEHWLRTAQDCELGNSEKIDETLEMNNEVIRVITSTIQTIRAKQGIKNVREDLADYLTDTELSPND